MLPLEPKQRWVLFTIILIGTILRAYGIWDLSLSNDELSALARTVQPDLGHLLEQGVKTGDLHPAGVQLFIYAWTALFGYDPILLKVPFIILGLASVFVIFQIGRVWSGIQMGLIAAAMLAVMEYPILYSRLARPYSPGLFFGLLTLYFWSRVLILRTGAAPRRIDLILLTISMTTCMYIHHYCALYVGLLGLVGLLFTRKPNWKGYVASGTIALLLYIPHLGITSYQMGIGGVGGAGGWLGPPQDNWLIDHLEYAFNGTIFLGALAAIFCLRVLLERKYFKLEKTSITGFALGFLLIFTAYYYSIYRNPIFQHSILLFSFPLLLLFIADLISMKNEYLVKITLVTILVVGSFTTIFTNAFYRTAHFGEFKAVAQHTEDWTKEFGSENITYLTNVNAPYYAQFYLRDSVPFSTYLIDDESKIAAFDSILTRSTNPYCLFSWSTIENRPETYAILRDQYPFLIKDEKFFNSRVSVFSKTAGTEKTRMAEWQYSKNAGWKSIEPKNAFADTTSWFVAPEEEYSTIGTFSWKDFKIRPEQNALIQLSVDVKSKSKSNLILVADLLNADSSVEWHGMNSDRFQIEVGEWHRIHLVVPINDRSPKASDLKVYLWTPEQYGLEYKDLVLSISEDI